jgi:hypothetical protein
MKTESFIFILLAIFLFGCENTNTDGDLSKNYPIDITMNDYNLPVNCNPTNKLEADTLYVINSQDKLLDMISCLDNVSDIDWEKKSLLIAWNRRCNADSKVIEKKFQQVSDNAYQLQIEISPSMTANGAPLIIYMLVPKLPENAEVSLSISLQGIGNGGTFQLKNTQWKLAGLVDVTTGKLTEAEPKDCGKCYTLAFETDSVGTAVSVANEIIVQLFQKPFFQVATKVYDSKIGNVALFYEAIKTIDFYFLDQEGLKFFYNDRKNFLLYKTMETEGTKHPQSITVNTIAQGTLHGGGREGFSKQNLVIKTQAEWEQLKTAINKVNQETDHFLETDIDFSVYQAIAAFEEVKGNGGWSIDIANITESPDSVIVSIQNVKKGNATSVITQPYHIVKMPTSEKKIVFHY